MGYVTKTVTESAGDVAKTTSYLFETLDDFLRWEESQAPNQEEKVGVEVGRQYRVIGNVMRHGFEVGEKVEAIRVAPTDEYGQVRASNGEKEYWMREEELEEV